MGYPLSTHNAGYPLSGSSASSEAWDAMAFRAGDRVLVPDLEHAYLSATVLQPTQAGLTVRLADESTRTLDQVAAAQVVLADPLALQGDDDMVRSPSLLTRGQVVYP